MFKTIVTPVRELPPLHRKWSWLGRGVRPARTRHESSDTASREAAGFGRRTRQTAADVSRAAAREGPSAGAHSGAGIASSCASFFSAIALVAAEILLALENIWVKAYLAMGAAHLVRFCIPLTNTLRDVHESTLVNRIGDAKAEGLLMEIERGKTRNEQPRGRPGGTPGRPRARPAGLPHTPNS
jgi:hypothetical protein